jgi:hypothetical protein
MPFAYNTETNAIRMAVGDTGGFSVRVEWDRLAKGDVILFAIFDPSADGDLLCKPVGIKDGRAYIRLCNHDTRDIEPGRYKWNLRIVTSPVYDDDGNVRVDECTDDVITVFDTPPTIQLTRGGAAV